MSAETITIVGNLLGFLTGAFGGFYLISGIIAYAQAHASQDPQKQDKSYSSIAGGVALLGLALAMPTIVEQVFNLIPALGL